ncbi:MAG: hypothetical protein QXD43_06055, partial [Candidatus Aenigmatarchaeota archaeon]
EKEIDFLYNSIPIEVKTKVKISKEDMRWLEFFIKKYKKSLNVNKGYIITKNIEGKVNNIYLIPLWQFCLNGL